MLSLSLVIFVSLWLRFYCATRMHSADYAVARCLSVRSSHAGILSTPLNISSKYLPSGSPIILVFPYQTGWQYSHGDPLTGRRMQGVWKNHDFRQICRFILELMQDVSYYKRGIGNRTQALEWYRFEWPWVTSNPDFKVTILFNVK